MGCRIRKWEAPIVGFEDAQADETLGEWVPVGDADYARLLVASSNVESGATVLLEGNTIGDGSGDTFTVLTITANANGVKRDEVSVVGDDGFAAYRARVSAYTDGKHTAKIQMHR